MVQFQNNDEDKHLEFGILHQSNDALIESESLMTPPEETNANSIPTDIPHIRLCVLGSKGVGKTAIIVRYLTRRFIGEYRSQIDVCYSHVLALGNRLTYIEILDFSPKGEEIFIPRDAASTSDSFLVVFSISDRLSFLQAVNIASILRSFPQSSSDPLTLLGNKKDLDHSRQVSLEELQNISALLKCDYAEVSVSESREDIVPIIFNIFVKVMKTSTKFTKSLTKKITNSSSSSSLNHDKTSKNKEPKRSQSRSKHNSLHAEICSKQDCDCENTLNPTNLKNCLDKNNCENRINDWNEDFSREVWRKGAVRYGNHSPLTRTRSLHYKEKDRTQEAKRSSGQKQVKSSSFRVNERKLSKEMKQKDCMFNSFINCSSSVSEEPNASIAKHQDSCSKKESGSMSPRCNRKANSTNKANLPKLSTLKKTPPLRARKNLHSRFPSREACLSFTESTNLNPGYRNFQDRKLQSNQLSVPVVRPAFGDLSTARSYSKLTPTAVNTLKNYTNAETKPKNVENRERKFGVFGKGVLANVLSKTSLPDLPKPTYILCKLDSIKKTIHNKRSL